MTLDTNDTVTANLEEFEHLSVKSINPTLDEYLRSISRTGDTCYNWCLVKPLLCYKMERVLEDFMEMVVESADESAPTAGEFAATKERLCALLNGFYRAPFTVQRFLELLLEPNKHYKKFDKYCRGLEKVLSVVTTVDPYHKISNSSLLPNTVLNGNGLMDTVEEEKNGKPEPMVNGDAETHTEIESYSEVGEESKKRPVESEENTSKRQKVETEAAVEEEGGAVSPDSTTNEEEPAQEKTAEEPVQEKVEEVPLPEKGNSENEVTTTTEEKIPADEALSDVPSEQTKGG